MPDDRWTLIFLCPYCDLELTKNSLIRPVKVDGGRVCPGCFMTVYDEVKPDV